LTSRDDTEQLDVSAVVVSWNTCDLLRRCLESLESELEGRPHELIVVDNDSSDGSSDMVRREFPQVTLLALKENVGYGRAANRAARDARGRFLLIANADVAARAGAIEQLLAAAARHHASGAFAPRLLLPSGATQHSVFPFPSVGTALALNLGLQRPLTWASGHSVILGAGNPDVSLSVPWALGACLLIRREAWVSVEGFDEELWMYAEDLDLAWRLCKAGWGTYYVPDASFDHVASAATRQLWGEERFARGVLSGYAWIRRRLGRARARVIAAIYVGGSSLRWAVFGVLALVDPERWDDKRGQMLRSAKLHAQGLRPLRALREKR
jgi:GT2 family glycosyltransferase